MEKSSKQFVVIGGGTGSFTVLSALRPHATNITALVSMADDGGSTGVLRDELGVLPPGDVRQCLVALSNASQPLRDLFNFRFEEGSFAGHSFGNLFLSATEKMSDNFDDAVKLAGEVLQISGRVIPITLDDVRLAIQWGSEVVRGEGTIDTMDFGHRLNKKPKLFLEPTARINPSADQALRAADVIIIAPGDLYTSLGPLLVVDGVAEALKASTARKLYISNLVSSPQQTKDFSVDDYVAELERFAGHQFIDTVIYNTGSPEKGVLDRYIRAGELLVTLPAKTQRHFAVAGSDLLSTEGAKAKKGDKLAAHRSLIRHDHEALAEAIMRQLGQ